MPFPTTQWGNLGNTLSSTQVSADIYPAAPGPTPTAPGSADGPVLGNFTVLPDGTFVQFLQSQGSTAANAACKAYDSGTTVWQNTFLITPTTAITDICGFVNDRALVALTANQCTWFTSRGLAFPLVAATIAQNVYVAPSATLGTLSTATPGTTGQYSMVNTVLVGGVAAKSPVLMYMG